MVVQPPSSASDETPSAPKPTARIVMASIPIIATQSSTISAGPHPIVEARGLFCFNSSRVGRGSCVNLRNARDGSAVVQSVRGTRPA